MVAVGSTLLLACFVICELRLALCGPVQALREHPDDAWWSSVLTDLTPERSSYVYFGPPARLQVLIWIVLVGLKLAVRCVRLLPAAWPYVVAVRRRAAGADAGVDRFPVWIWAVPVRLPSRSEVASGAGDT